MRKKYTMNDEQYNRLLAACVPVAQQDRDGKPVLAPSTLRVNTAWIALGEELGFDAGTVAPGSNDHEFTADVLEPGQSIGD